jgi:hypothetical protein
VAQKTSGAKKLNNKLPPDVAAIVAKLEEFLDLTDEQGRRWCDAKCGVYAFYDFDGEPIYVGQTRAQLRVRLRRHMTNQRTDAVAMRVLDPLEVADIEVWPFWEFQNVSLSNPDFKKRANDILNTAEYTLFDELIKRSKLHRVLNEKLPMTTEKCVLPKSHRARIIPDEMWERLNHTDERNARRALKISELAQVIRQRDVSVGLRNTRITQAERLLSLSRERYDEIAGSLTPYQRLIEELGPEDESESA